MQEIALILSSLAGVATAAAVRKAPRNKNQLLSLGASSHIKNQLNSLKIEKEILTKTISRLYEADEEFSKIQKDKLLLKYQHQLGIILAKIEKLDQASKHPDLGPVGDGLITLMDQKLSKLDDRLYEISSRIAKTEKISNEQELKKETKQETPKTVKNSFNFEKQKNSKIEPIEITPTRSKQSFELTTLTNVSRKEPKFPLFEEKQKQSTKPMPEPRKIQTEIKPKQETVQNIVEPKIEKQQITITQTNPKTVSKIDIKKEVDKITEHKALPEPKQEQKPKSVEIDDGFEDDSDDLDKIKGDIMKVLSKLDQAEVE